MDKKEISIIKNKKYNICSCGLSNILPFCDNKHRKYNDLNQCSYKSVKISAKKSTILEIFCSNWEKYTNE